MAIVEVTIAPLGTASPSISQYVAACHGILQRETGVKHQLTPMGTILEGDLDEILRVIRLMHEVPFDQGCQRVSTLIRIDDRRDKAATMEAKVAAVLQKTK